MSIPPNIDRFNKTTLLVFDTLYQAFPVPIELDAGRIAMDTLPPDATFDESFDSIAPAFHAIQFLAKEGFIEYSNLTLDGRTFIQVRLTTKSLAILGQTPSALEPQVTISDRFRAIVKGGIKEAGSETAKKAIELLFANAPSLQVFGLAAGSGS